MSKKTITFAIIALFSLTAIVVAKNETESKIKQAREKITSEVPSNYPGTEIVFVSDVEYMVVKP